jgi:hypothetical protein
MDSAESCHVVSVSPPVATRSLALGRERESLHVTIRRPSERDVAECALAISTVERASGFARRLEIGALILDRVFCDWQEGCVRRVAGQSSFRRLAEALDGAMSKSELYRCAMVCQLCRRLPFVQAVAHFSVSHLEAVDGLPLDEQERLLREAEAGRWPVRQLRQAKMALLPASLRPRASARNAAAIRRITSLKEAVLKELGATQRVLSSLDDGDSSHQNVGVLLEQITALGAACAVCAAASEVAAGGKCEQSGEGR